MTTAGPSVDTRERRLRQATLGTLITLLVQLLVGMYVNLFVTIPDDHPGAQPTEYFGGAIQSVSWALTQGPLALVIHVVLGIVLLLGAIGLIVRAIPLHRRSVTVLAVLGLLSIVGAGFNGASFLNYNEDVSSMLMAIFFALAALCYVVLLDRLAGSIEAASQVATGVPSASEPAAAHGDAQAVSDDR
jgi:hypothetical protein